MSRPAAAAAAATSREVVCARRPRRRGRVWVMRAAILARLRTMRADVDVLLVVSDARACRSSP